jgi:microcystin-dependent protein|tara:strand:+ start:3345 stop:4751 length:1407 start_codon:yes stop_codon:yes gene_type:complete
MGSTYTDNGGIEKIGLGEQAGAWGTTTNNNFDIIDRLVNGVGAITLSGTTHTLTTSDGSLSDGMFKVLVLGGSPSGTNTVTISPNNADKLYFVKNSSGQSATFTQGSGANVTVENGKGAIIFADGAGSGAAVTSLSALFPNTDTAGTGTFSSITANGGVVVDNITIDGTEIDLSSGDLTLDVAGNIVLDADGGTVKVSDGGTEILNITNSSSDVIIKPVVDAKDIIFQQRDGTEVARIEDNGTFNVVTGKLAINATAITSTAAEVNLLDGDTSVGSSITIADADGVIVNDGGTMKSVPASDLRAYSMPAGAVTPFAGASAPTGFLLCDGAAISRSTYSVLFTAISTTYGTGDGSSTFNVPDLRGRVVAGQDDMGGSSANRLTDQTGGLNGDTLGDTGGSETHTLSVAQLPAHTHTVTAHENPGGSGDSNGSEGGDSSFDRTSTTSSTGSGSAHNNVQPTIILNYIIKT